MTAATTKLTLPFLQPGQALKTITHNEALQRLDAGIYLSCSDMTAETLPENPLNGHVIILSDSAGGPLAEHAGDIGTFRDGLWDWFTPTSGWSVWDQSGEIFRVFDGTEWVDIASQRAADILPQLGLNTSASPTQRLALASETSLFSHDGGSHRMTVNRAANTDVASLIFQTDYAGEAELGLNGPQGFSIKTTTDGNNWSERLSTPSGYAGLRAPAFGSIRIEIATDAAIFLKTPETGGIFAFTIVSDDGFPRASHSGLLAYDTGLTPALINLAKTSRIEMHNQVVLDGTVSAADNIGISAANGGLYFENRLADSRIISLVFLC